MSDIVQFMNYANYLAASPNNIPGKGLDYVNLMKSFTLNTTIEAVGQKIVQDYKTQYGQNSTLWDKYAAELGVNYNSLNLTGKGLMEWYGHVGFTTFTITDLSKIGYVKSAIDSLCNLLLSPEGKAKTIIVDANGYFSPTATSTTTTQNYVTYLGQHHANIVNFLPSATNSYRLDDYIYYQGSYTWLYDIGYIARMMQYFSATTIGSTTNENAWSDLNTAASNLITKLNDAIKYSWRDSKVASNGDFYSRIDNNSDFNHYFGLTICGANIATNGNSLTQGSCPSFYKTDLAFGAESSADYNWGDLLEYWFGTGN